MNHFEPKRPPRPSRSVLDSAYDQMKKDIIGGVHPPGGPLRLDALRDRYGVGASTVREALTKLAGSGLVNADGQRGFRVSAVSREDLVEVDGLRRIIESLAVRYSVEAGDDAWEANLVAAAHRLSKATQRLKQDPEQRAAEWERENTDFHDALVAACPYGRLLAFRKSLYDESARYRRLAFITRPKTWDMKDEHAAIFEAALARDLDLVCRLSEAHIERTTRQVLAQLEKG